MADDEDMEERVAFAFNQMDKNKSGSISYMQFLSWWKKQSKEAGDGAISDEVLRSSQEAFTEYDTNKNGGIELDEVYGLLTGLDLLKYVPEEVPVFARQYTADAHTKADPPRLSTICRFPSPSPSP